MLGGAIAEGAGILLLVPLATIAIGGAATAGTLAGLTNFADAFTPERRFTLVLVAFIVVMGLRSAIVFARDKRLAQLQAGYEASLRLRSASTLAARGWTFASGIGQAGMQSLLLNDVPRAALAAAQAQAFAVGAVMLFVQFVLAALLSPLLSLLALAIVAAASILAIGWLRRGVRSGMALVESSEASTGSGFRLHAGLKAALAQGTVSQFLVEYRSTLKRTRSEVARYQGDIAAARALAFTASAIAAAVLLFVGYRLLGLPFPILVTSLVLFARMAVPAQQLQQAAQYVAAYAPSFGAVRDRLHGIEDAPAHRTRAEPLEWRTLTADAVAYVHASSAGLRSASFELQAGEWAGLGGPSGSGKTTMLDVLTGLLAPQRGTLSIDGVPLTGEWLERWRSSLAYIGQDGALFDDSVRANLLADGAEASDDVLWSALRAAGLEQRVRSFAAGLDQRIGDRGSQLSGGERQRLAIARALLRRPTLLILDEATSALDPESEAAVIAALQGLEPRPAAVLVAHRASTLGHCDSRFRIQDGVLEPETGAAQGVEEQ
ncbi:ATP-binding cassette, subfamily C, bacterial [Sphingomonas sp. F9_3S_D5_B_2]